VIRAVTVKRVRRSAADGMLLATVALWALNFTVSKYILDQGLRPLAYSSIRYGCAALVVAAITLALEGSLRLARRDVPLGVCCVVVLFLNQLCFVYALSFTTAATAALLFGTLPIWTALLARGTGIERQSLRFWLATLLSFCGVALVAVGAGGKLSSDLKGDVLALCGAITWSAYSVAIAPLMRRNSPFRLSSVFLLSVTVPLLIVGSHQLHEQDFGQLDALVWVGFAFAVLGPIVLTNFLWFTAIGRVGPSRAALFANLQPFLGAVIALVVLSEPISALQIVGGVLLAGGILLAPRTTTPPAPDAD